MGVKIIFENADFSANAISPEFISVQSSDDWTGWLCNYNGGTTAQQNASWSTAFYEIPDGAASVYLTGAVSQDGKFGVSLISDYNTASHTYTNVAVNIEAMKDDYYLNKKELSLASYPTAKYVMWCRVASSGLPVVEVLE